MKCLFPLVLSLSCVLWVQHFPILNTMVKLETHDRTRHLGMSCQVCRYAIVGLRYREVRGKFDLCATCYSECKVPSKYQKAKSFTFGEYVGGTDRVRSSLGLYGRSLSRSTTRSALGSRTISHAVDSQNSVPPPLAAPPATAAAE